MGSLSSGCWLCLNCKQEQGQAMHTFILQNISKISTKAITDMVVNQILEIQPEANRGTVKAQVKEHIEGKHILCPSLQVAHILRSLLDLKETLQGMIITEDENGVKTVDAKHMAIYLKVISEIMQVYKTGEVSKLLFASEEKTI
jgi:hypothetical protein